MGNSRSRLRRGAQGRSLRPEFASHSIGDGRRFPCASHFWRPLLPSPVSCPRCRYRYSTRTGLNPLTTACHVNQSTAEYHYRHFPEGKADVFDVQVTGGVVAVATTPRPFRKVIV